MKQHKTNLCIGGPWDGKRFDTDLFRFRVPLLPKMVAVLTTPEEIADGHLTISETGMDWRCGPDEMVSVFAPDHMSPCDVMKRLLKHYKPEDKAS